MLVKKNPTYYTHEREKGAESMLSSFIRYEYEYNNNNNNVRDLPHVHLRVSVCS